MRKYKLLNQEKFELEHYSLVPIREDDKFDIMNWRNEQIYHLRQNKLLTKEDQANYFEKVVSKLFEIDKPTQLLFSFLENEICIGYGGLVHINWVDLHAEISFVMNTKLEKEFFNKYWNIYLRILEDIAFNHIYLHKIYTYAFDLRPNVYEVLEDSGFYRESTLKDHCLFEGKYIDVIIHSKINKN